MCSLGACHTPSGGGSRCYSTCLPDHPPPSRAVQTHSPAPLTSASPLCFYRCGSHFHSLPFLAISLSPRNSHQKTTRDFVLIAVDALHLVKRQKPLAIICLRRPEASAFGHLMAWMGPLVGCSWPVPLDTVGLRGPLPGTPLSPAFYGPNPLHPPTVSNSDWAPVCVIWAHTDPASVSISKGPTVNMGYNFNMSREILQLVLVTRVRCGWAQDE